jgi:transposase InsO family protein
LLALKTSGDVEIAVFNIPEVFMSHRNARLTLHGRLLLAHRVRVEGMPIAHVAKAMGISRQCASRWVARFDAEGEAGLVDRSSRPRTSPLRTSAEDEALVVAARAEHRRGPDWLGPELGIPARTVTRVLRRHHVPRLCELDPLTGAVIRSSKTTAVRYERDRPGELVHMDLKKIGRIPDGGGWRAHGRAAGSTSRDRKTKVGYDYVHSLVDDHSRLAYSEIHPDERAGTVAGFYERATTYFAGHGIDRIERLMTDNAFSYRHGARLRDLLVAAGTRHVFIKPHCPWQNGKVERLNRTLQTEWAYRQVFTTNDERAAALAPWIDYYNHQRRHSAIGGLPPTSRLSPT